MRSRKDFLISLILLCTALLCCKKEKSLERQQDQSLDHWKFSVGETATSYHGPTDTADYIVSDSDALLTITGPAESGTGRFSIKIHSSGAITAATFADADIAFRYFDSGDTLLRNTELQSGPFRVTITAIDSISVKGIFSGAISDETGQPLNIKEGQFSAPLRQSVAVTGNGPPALEGDWFPLQDRWTYGDPSIADTLAIKSSGTTILDGKSYTIFKNDVTLEQRFYRKSGSKYYEYVTYFKDAPLVEPVELLFLQDDVAPGIVWQSDAGHPIIRGFAVDARIKSRIMNKGHKRSFNGKTYYDLIEVQSELLIKGDNGGYTPFGPPVITVFAKGIGVVYYQDEIFEKTRSIISYSVTP
jgi:hypothetical protein